MGELIFNGGGGGYQSFDFVSSNNLRHIVEAMAF